MATDADRVVKFAADLQAERIDKWRTWAQFVFLNGGAPSGTDAELQMRVCAAWDDEHEALLSACRHALALDERTDCFAGNEDVRDELRAALAASTPILKAKEGTAHR